MFCGKEAKTGHTASGLRSDAEDNQGQKELTAPAGGPSGGGRWAAVPTPLKSAIPPSDTCSGARGRDDPEPMQGMISYYALVNGHNQELLLLPL